jgi:ribosomal protein S20
LRGLQKQIRSAPERSADQIRAAISAIDKAAKSRIIHRNAANRRKARLNKTLISVK